MERFRPHPIFSIVCHLLAQTVRVDRENMHPTDVNSFLFFFSFAGLPRTYEGSELRNAADTTNSCTQENYIKTIAGLLGTRVILCLRLVINTP